MNERLSNKLKWLSFVATWAVVCIPYRTDQWRLGLMFSSQNLSENTSQEFLVFSRVAVNVIQY